MEENHMAQKRKRFNTCLYIAEREAFGASLRGDLKTLRFLMQNDRYNFQKVWEKTSKSPIGFDCRHLFFDKFRTCYTSEGHNGIPSILFKLPPCRTSEKIESAVVFESPIDQDSLLKSQKCSGYSSSIFGVTANGWLMRYDLDSGKPLQQVYLSTKYKFKSIAWETDLYRIVIKSIHFKSSPTSGGQPGSSLLMYLAVFNVAPLEVLTVLQIDKNVFGQDVVDASVNSGFLVIMHQSCLMQFYNFEEIIQNYSSAVKLGFPFKSHKLNPLNGTTSEVGMDIVGHYPFGLPLNVHFPSKPTPLFQILSNHYFVSFGGKPWHYINIPKGRDSVFHVSAIEGNVLVKNGVLTSDTLSIESDQAYFHGDHSGRILHIGANTLRCLKLSETFRNKAQISLKLETCYVLHFDTVLKNENTVDCRYTSSGRLVKRRKDDSCSISSAYETIQDVDYEDELDLLVILSSLDSDHGRIGLYDNQTGVCIKETLIKEWDQDSCHSIMMEQNVILHIIKSPSGMFSAHLYRLQTKD